ncbi:MAG: glycosidase [Phycisphaerae bacterium SM23_33]|nr:MAG: glycosidase [Phycisphaerae bacterium SM23_33]
MINGRREWFTRHPSNPILTIEDWPYPANSVFNAGATLIGGETLLLVRVEDQRGMSHLCAARSADGISNWRIDPQPTFPADPVGHPEEVYGVEDPRITYIEELGEYAIAYTAYSEGGPLVALATTKDFRSFRRLGPIMAPDDKDAALFPVRFGRRWAMIHRPQAADPTRDAHIWLSFSPDLKHWGDFRVLLRARQGGWWDARKIGLSPPPIRTPEGWLLIYHGVRVTAAGAIYRLGLALLDLNDPAKILRRTDAWVFGPKESYEVQGDVDHVVFPCGAVLLGEEVRLYYGGADTCIALACGNLGEILQRLLELPPYEPLGPPAT